MDRKKTGSGKWVTRKGRFWEEKRVLTSPENCTAQLFRHLLKTLCSPKRKICRNEGTNVPVVKVTAPSGGKDKKTLGTTEELSLSGTEKRVRVVPKGHLVSYAKSRHPIELGLLRGGGGLWGGEGVGGGRGAAGGGGATGWWGARGGGGGGWWGVCGRGWGEGD